MQSQAKNAGNCRSNAQLFMATKIINVIPTTIIKLAVKWIEHNEIIHCFRESDQVDLDFGATNLSLNLRVRRKYLKNENNYRIEITSICYLQCVFSVMASV